MYINSTENSCNITISLNDRLLRLSLFYKTYLLQLISQSITKTKIYTKMLDNRILSLISRLIFHQLNTYNFSWSDVPTAFFFTNNIVLSTYALQLNTKAIICHIGFTFYHHPIFKFTSLMAKLIQFVIGSGGLLFLFWFANIFVANFCLLFFDSWNGNFGNSIFTMKSCRCCHNYLFIFQIFFKFL